MHSDPFQESKEAVYITMRLWVLQRTFFCFHPSGTSLFCQNIMCSVASCPEGKDDNDKRVWGGNKMPTRMQST